MTTFSTINHWLTASKALSKSRNLLASYLSARASTRDTIKLRSNIPASNKSALCGGVLKPNYHTRSQSTDEALFGGSAPVGVGDFTSPWRGRLRRSSRFASPPPPSYRRSLSAVTLGVVLLAS